MSLFDNVLSGLAGGDAGGERSAGLPTLILEMLINRQGGISGLLEAFQRNGLGHLVSSWISTGANLPVSAEQIQSVLGSEQLLAFAEKAGLSPGTANSQLADLLPGIVDKLTPGGAVPQGGNLSLEGAGRLVQGMFFGEKAES